MTALELEPAATSALPIPNSPWPRPQVRGDAFRSAAHGVAAAGMLLVLAVPLLACALVIKATSRGPVIYRQTRYGRNGIPFRMWKFRTMIDRAERIQPAANDADGLLYKLRRDPRVTPVGRVLRRWSLDELPQLVNVLLGHMALVGPRPLPVPPHAYCDRGRQRLLVKPGITGLWQVSGRSDLSWDDCLRLDLTYVRNRSLRLDLRIIGSTLAAIVRRAGAY